MRTWDIRLLNDIINNNTIQESDSESEEVGVSDLFRSMLPSIKEKDKACI